MIYMRFSTPRSNSPVASSVFLVTGIKFWTVQAEVTWHGWNCSLGRVAFINNPWEFNTLFVSIQANSSLSKERAVLINSVWKEARCYLVVCSHPYLLYNSRLLRAELSHEYFFNQVM